MSFKSWSAAQPTPGKQPSSAAAAPAAVVPAGQAAAAPPVKGPSVRDA